MNRTTRRSAVTLLAATLAIGSAYADSPAVSAVTGTPVLMLSGFDLAPLGYTTSEFFVSGTATSYKPAGTLGGDGRWDAVPAATAPFTTRVVVVRPADPKKFNGTVVVEWLNVTAGADGSPDWNATHRELIRSGYAYMGVSAQKAGIDGGSALGLGAAPLKKSDPARYGSLVHPGDAFSYDMFSQAGRLLRSPEGGKLLGTLVPRRLIAVGESQSAVFLTTYVNAVDPLAKVYDGFLIHSRFGAGSGLESPGIGAPSNLPKYVRLREDLRVPVITVITETDLMGSRLSGFYGARQPDNRRLRVWEVPGTSHADNYTFEVGRMDSGSAPLEKIAAEYKPSANILGMAMAKPANNAPQHHHVVTAALSSLNRWISTGRASPSAPPMLLNAAAKPDDAPTFAVDANGLVRGGVRTPWVDVPVARLSGAGNTGGPLAFLVGVAEPFDAPTLARLYPGGKAEYLRKFSRSLDSAIRAGFILPAERKEILQLAELGYPAT
jgi:hypothetical protein